MKVSEWTQEIPQLARSARFERDADIAPKNIVLTRDDGAKLVFKCDGVIEAALLAKNIMQAATTGPKRLNAVSERQRSARALRALREQIDRMLETLG